MGQDMEENSSSIFKSENDDDKHHHELFRHSEMTNGKVEPTMKRILKDLGERHMTDDNSFLRQTWKRI